MLVAFDSNVLIWLFRDPDVDQRGLKPETIEYQKRAKILALNLEQAKAQIVVPTIAIAECLCGTSPKQHGQFILEFQDRFFHIPTFDLRAAAKSAELWQIHKKLPEAERMERRTLKLDVMIVACAHAAGVGVFYSHDGKCRRMAERAGMVAKDLPTHSEDLLTDAEQRLGRPL